jgi:hypothetical protein
MDYTQFSDEGIDRITPEEQDSRQVNSPRAGAMGTWTPAFCSAQPPLRGQSLRFRRTTRSSSRLPSLSQRSSPRRTFATRCGGD